MAITTYSELQTAITNWFDDGELSAARIQECIDLCEAELKTEVDLIETDRTATASLSTSSRYLALPDYYVGGKRMRLIDPDDTDLVYSVTFTTPNGLNEHYTTDSVQPTHVSVNDGQLEFNSIPDKAYTAQFLYSAMQELSDSNTTNSVFPSFLNAYLYGTLKHAAIFSNEDGSTYERQYEIFLSKVKKANRKKKYPAPRRANTRYS